MMQKSEFVREVSQRTGLTKQQVLDVLKAQANLIAEQLIKDGGVNLPDLGKAKVKLRKPVAERHSVNPRTGEPMVIPPVPSKKTYQVRLGLDFLHRLEEIEAVGAGVK